MDQYVTNIVEDNIIDAIYRQGFWCAEIPHLHRFILTAKPRTCFTYFIGQSLTSSILSKKLKKLTYHYAVNGLVYLFQPRYKDDLRLFEYICMRASTPPALSLLPWSDDKLKERGYYVEETASSDSQAEQLHSQ